MRFNGKSAKTIIYYSVNTIVPLALGVILYVFTRPGTIISQIIYDCFQANRRINIALPTILSDYGCDFLWSYSLVHCLFLVSRSYKFSLFVCIAFSVFIEVIQLLPFVRLVFDPIDIVVEIIGIIIGLCIITIFEHCIQSINNRK